MFRFRPFLRAARCHYDILGIRRGANEDELKRAFQGLAKTMHPDAGKSTSCARGFQEVVDAYRVLRDPKSRAEYDSGAFSQSSGFGGGGATRQQTSSQGPDAVVTPRIPVEAGILILGGLWFISPFSFKRKAVYKDPEYPRKLPTTTQYAPRAATPDADTYRPAGESVDELVRAFYDPYVARWMRIPDGYEPPGAVDLTAWYHKRTTRSEWSKQYASGQLSKVMPRGGLHVRYVPAYETHHPMIVGDPFTGKTVLANKCRASDAHGQCEVQF